MGKRGSGLSLQYLATFNLIFVTGSTVLEPLGLLLFTSTKYSMSTLCFYNGQPWKKPSWAPGEGNSFSIS